VNIAKIILDYLRVLAWPLVVLSLAALFRREVVSVILRLKKADLPGGISLEFAAEARAVRELALEVADLPQRPEAKGAPAIPLTEANARLISLGLQPSPSGLDMNYYRSLADQDPNIALAGLRIEVDVLARNLARGFHVEVSDRDSGVRLLRRLLEAGAITPGQFELAQTVMRLCNAAVHGTRVSKDAAISVIDAAQVLSREYLSWLGWGFPGAWKPEGPTSMHS
jgi:hypothetical protein